MSARRFPVRAGLALAAALALLAGATGLGAGAVWARAPARSAASAPVVQSMVVGANGAVLSPARSVPAGAGSVRVGSRTCAVAAGTPLAVLLVLRQAGGPGFALRDYGRCDSSPRNSGQLFVYSIGGESNRGQNGWEYKVAGVAGSTGAGDPSGPSGNGRLLGPGQQVLWFWCQAYAGGCQRTLTLSPSAQTVSPRASLSVSVRGDDNEGRGRPVAGAIVTLGSDFASSSSSGRAALIAPSVPGRYQLQASRPGLVPAFPETIVVR